MILLCNAKSARHGQNQEKETRTTELNISFRKFFRRKIKSEKSDFPMQKKYFVEVHKKREKHWKMFGCSL